MSTEELNILIEKGPENICIIVDKNLNYYSDLKIFLDSYNQKLFEISFIEKALEANDINNTHHYDILELENKVWSGTFRTLGSTKPTLHLYRDRDILHSIFRVNSNKLTINEIKELKKTIWIKLNSEQEIKNAYDLLVKYNQIIYKDKDGIPLLVGNDHMSDGFLGMNSKNQPQFGLWSNNIHNATHTEEIKVKYNFIIDNLELLEHLFKQEEELINK